MNEMQRCAGINITASRLQFVEVEKELNQLLISNIGQTFISPPINFEDQVEANIQTQLQTAFDEIKIRNPIASSFASFTLPPELFITIQLPYDGNLNQNEIREEFNWEISQLFPYISIDELAIKFYELGNDFLPGKNNALVVALNKRYLIQIKNFCSKNNLIPRLVDSSPIAANSFINKNTSNIKESITINIFDSRNSITLFINVSSKPGFVKVFLKRDNGIINSLISELLQDKFKEVLNKPFTKAVVSGDDLRTDSLSELQIATGLEFRKFNPFDVVKFKSEIQDHELSSEQFSSFTSATGIASRFS
jgi:hypothetical protein